MRILFLTHGTASNKLINWLQEVAGEEVIVNTGELNEDYLLITKPEFIISYGYRYIIRENIINKFSQRAINLHISLLPWNRGADPNLWSFVEGTPKGVTIHQLDKGIDTGDVLFQKEVKFNEETETLVSSYDKLHQEIQDLFMRNWQIIKENKANPLAQKSEGNIHYKRDFEAIQHILGKDGWSIKVTDLIKKFKQLTFGEQNKNR